MPFEFDESTWPIPVVTGTGDATSEDVDEYLQIQTELLKKEEPHALIFDVRNVGHMKAADRSLIGQWLKQHAASLRMYRRGFAYVTESMATRGLLTAILWVSPPPYPYKIFSNMEEARAWAEEMMG